MVTGVLKKMFKFCYQLQSIKEQAYLVPSVISSLIRVNFCFLSENQKWSEPEPRKKFENC